MISDSTDWFIGSHLLPNPKCPIIFDDINGTCEVDEQGSSYNIGEAEAAIAYVKRLLGWSEKRIHPSHIGNTFFQAKFHSFIKNIILYSS